MDVPVGDESEVVESGIGCSVVTKIDIAHYARVGSSFKGDGGGASAAPEIDGVIIEWIVALDEHVHSDASRTFYSETAERLCSEPLSPDDGTHAVGDVVKDKGVGHGGRGVVSIDNDNVDRV